MLNCGRRAWDEQLLNDRLLHWSRHFSADRFVSTILFIGGSVPRRAMRVSSAIIGG